jgi:citrate lyase beta subunit
LIAAPPSRDTPALRYGKKVAAVLEILRSLLFVPAGRERMLETAARVPADAIVLDLEDAVPAARKASARAMARRSVATLAKPRRRVTVRVNDTGSGLTRDDLLAVVTKGLHAVIVPKADHPQALRDIDVLLREAEIANGVRPGDVGVIPLIESAQAVLRSEEIATAIDRVIGLAVGGEDYTVDIGAPRGEPALRHIRAVVVQVAAAHGLLAIDTPYPHYRDDEGLQAEAEQARAVGLRGKLAIHPDQVPIINRAFSPTEDEVTRATRIVEAFDAAPDGAIGVDGQMVDAPIVARARAVLSAAKRRR